MFFFFGTTDPFVLAVSLPVLQVFLRAGFFCMLRLCLKGFGELIQFGTCGFRSGSTAKNPID